jgi:hypothetical protein
MQVVEVYLVEKNAILSRGDMILQKRGAKKSG